MSTKSSNLPIRIRQNASVKEKTLIRVVAETLKKLVHLYQVKSAEEILMSFEIQALRYKLKECLSRLMFLEPLEFGQKAEDTIWKSIFYEPIRIFKRELKNKPNLSASKSIAVIGFKRHILGAIGYYQKLIMRLETEYGHVGMSGMTQEMDDGDGVKEVSEPMRLWSSRCIQHCLLYIGDLYRYEHDIKTAHSRILATRYYRLVLRLNPSLGHAYNQLATLDTSSYYGLEAAYYYLKAQHCELAFVQAKDNLEILFERNVKRLRGVIDRETQVKKSGSGASRGGLKVLRLKACLIKYLNLWHSFASASSSPSIDNHEMKQLAAMCDDVLNSFSYVLGFDRKLVPESSSTAGARPSTLNSETVSEVLFIAHACLQSLQAARDGHGDDHSDGASATEGESGHRLANLAHTFTLNLYGHVFNQCLVRVRDEIRAAGVDVALLFRRQELQGREDDAEEREGSEGRPRRPRRAALSRRLARGAGASESKEDEDLSEDEGAQQQHEVLWDEDDEDDSSGGGDDDGGRGEEAFGWSDDDEGEGEDETEFESDEQIHSQDEDDQIIRAIVGQGTVFGRQQREERASQRQPHRARQTYHTVPPAPSQDPQQPQRAPKTRAKAPALPSTNQPHPQVLTRCLANVDLLQALSLPLHALAATCTSGDSFHAVWPSSPYLWKHLSVLLNFCEGLLDSLPHPGACPGEHRLPESGRMQGCPRLYGHSPADGGAEHGGAPCEDGMHLLAARVQQIFDCALKLAGDVPGGPIRVRGAARGARLWTSVAAVSASDWPRANVVSAAFSSSVTAASNHASAAAAAATHQTGVTGTADRDKVMREMARLRLENELSSSESEDVDQHARSPELIGNACGSAGRAVYILPDADTLCSHLSIMRALLRSLQFIVVIPQAVIQRLDRKKVTEHGARQAIKFLEAEMNHGGGEHLQIETAPTAHSTSSLPCELIHDWPSLSSSALRLAQSSASVSSGHVVVTVLTHAAPHLPPAFTAHYAALRVDFKTNIDL